ncbi:SLOG family protein [Christensenella hongkongensis]|uniref:SLOG family protein n=1 Tax=Christensenella hongkongensis TaxID=270498 RepID=UPI002286DD7E|nr:SLOG family protein [Christensenella hongkongensis]
MQHGYTTFLCGMAQSFDILCGEIVLRLRKHPDCEHIRLVAVIPYMEHSERWKEDWRLRHANLEANADQILYVQEEYSRDCFFEPNHFMVNNSSSLICYYDGKRGGTEYTLKYALKQKKYDQKSN